MIPGNPSLKSDRPFDSNVNPSVEDKPRRIYRKIKKKTSPNKSQPYSPSHFHHSYRQTAITNELDQAAISTYITQNFDELLANSLNTVKLKNSTKNTFCQNLCEVVINAYQKQLQANKSLVNQGKDFHYDLIFDLAGDLLTENLNFYEALSVEKQEELDEKLTEQFNSFNLS